MPRSKTTQPIDLNHIKAELAEPSNKNILLDINENPEKLNILGRFSIYKKSKTKIRKMYSNFRNFSVAEEDKEELSSNLPSKSLFIAVSEFGKYDEFSESENEGGESESKVDDSNAHLVDQSEDLKGKPEGFNQNQEASENFEISLDIPASRKISIKTTKQKSALSSSKFGNSLRPKSYAHFQKKVESVAISQSK